MNNSVNIFRTIQTNSDGTYTITTQTLNVDGTINNNIEHYQNSGEIPYNYLNNNIDYNYSQPSISIINNLNNILFGNNIWNNLNESEELDNFDELYEPDNVNSNNQLQIVNNIGNIIFPNIWNNLNIINENINENINDDNNDDNNEIINYNQNIDNVEDSNNPSIDPSNNPSIDPSSIESYVEEIINTVDDSIIYNYNSNIYFEIETIDIYLKSIYINYNSGFIVTNALTIFIENVYKKLYARYYEYDDITRSLCLYLLINYELNIEDAIERIKPILTNEIKLIQNRRNILQQFIQLLRSNIGLDNNNQSSTVLTLEQFNKLKIVNLNELEETVCSVCSDKYTENDEIVCLDCSKTHHFHKDCIKEWTTKHKASCPLCRKPIESLI